jgi:hypothetical protein
MPTRVEEQAERYLRTPCPAKASRKKLRSVMWLNRNNLTGNFLFAEIGRKQGKKRSYRMAHSDTNNMPIFKDMLASFGGFFEEFTYTGERKKHTSGRRESRPRYIEKEK